MSSSRREKPSRVLERADRNAHTGVAIFLAHAEQDDPQQQLEPGDRSELLKQANDVTRLMDDSHRLHDGRLTGWLRSRTPPGRKKIDTYHEASMLYSKKSLSSSEKTEIGANNQIDARAPWSSSDMSAKASKERHAYIKPKMEKVLRTPDDAARGAPRAPRPPSGSPPLTRTGTSTRIIDEHQPRPSIPPSTVSSENDLTPRESLSESHASLVWRQSGTTPSAPSYHSTASDNDDDDDDDSSPSPWSSRPAPLQSQSGGMPPTTSRPRDAARGQLRLMNPSSQVTASETDMSETLRPSLTATESYHSIHSYSTAATVGSSSPRTSRLSSSTMPRYSQFTTATVATSAPEEDSPDTPVNSMGAPHGTSSYSTAATVATSSPRTSRLSSSSALRYSQFTTATVATSVPEGYPTGTPMNSMGATPNQGVSSHPSSHTPMPSSYHHATLHNPHTQTTGGHLPSIPAHQNVRSSHGGGMPPTQAPPGHHGHPSSTPNVQHTASHHPRSSTNNTAAVFVPPHPTGAYHSASAAQRPARSSQDSTSTGHWSTTANYGS